MQLALAMLSLAFGPPCRMAGVAPARGSPCMAQGESRAFDSLLQVRLSALHLDDMQSWLLRRSFASMLPMQPMLVLPLEPPQHGIELTFRGTATSEKGGTDGGMRFTLAREEEEEEGVLLVSRISEGQYCSKQFSEKVICRALVKDLAELPEECGRVAAVVDFSQGGAGGSQAAL